MYCNLTSRYFKAFRVAAENAWAAILMDVGNLEEAATKFKIVVLAFVPTGACGLCGLNVAPLVEMVVGSVQGNVWEIFPVPSQKVETN